MKTIVDWLIEMETTAHNFYREAVEVFRDDKDLSRFLTTLAEDEAMHKDLMEKAIECLDEVKFQPPVTLDAETISELKRPFAEGRELISRHTLTKEKLFDFIIETEFSEWNPIFLYAVNSLMENVADCFNIAPKIQLHEKYIRKFIEMNPDLPVHLDRFKTLPVIWKDKILIVDDEPLILKFLRDLFEREWVVETAMNGRDAMDKLRYSYFDVIVSDITMQDMDGITLYSESKKIWPDIGERFLFYSGNIMKFSDFFKENNVRYMMKPATLKQLREAVLGIAHSEINTRLGKAH